ncbi:HAD-IIA family hydrolase [Gordonia sputi]|uniref:HAD-IIA family hydrolase n=1 Tax=Gordonia sputi TaxID=36823 RepID=UPI0020437CDF|nr:HAD-IIA family hydrolase [Gordonia sputi]MCM3897963.1 HAD-IIA family hydrolase [Gordonia sputi]
MNDRDRGQDRRGRGRGADSRGRGPDGRGRASDRRGSDRRGSEGRPAGPPLPDDVVASDLDQEVRRDLLTLDKANADRVARHLVMVAQLLDSDPELALAHARAARERASRVGLVRETAGIAAYNAGEWQEALTELRAARRINGGTSLLPLIADAERGLGRPERAIEIARSEEGRSLTGDEATEMHIVEAGARIDAGEPAKALVTLQAEDLAPGRTGTMAARLFYAYASALLAADRRDDAVTWYMNAAAADVDDATDAEFRLMELSEDMSPDTASEDEHSDGGDVVDVVGAPEDTEEIDDTEETDTVVTDHSDDTVVPAAGGADAASVNEQVDDAVDDAARSETSSAPAEAATTSATEPSDQESAPSSTASTATTPVQAPEPSTQAPEPSTPVAERSAPVAEPSTPSAASVEQADIATTSTPAASNVSSPEPQAPPEGSLADHYEALLLDLDGTVFAGKEPTHGARETLDALDLPQIFVTNNASRRPNEVAAHLNSMGFSATEDQVVTSAQTAARLLSEHVEPGSRALVLGTDGLAQEVREVGVGVARSADDRPAAVIQGFSPDTNWSTLSEAALAIRAGALWIATNTDATLPSERGLLVGNGSLVAAVANATGAEPLVAGKPAAPLMADAMKRSGVTNSLVVGDRLDTDIQGAHSVGLDSALVLTGVSTPKDLLLAPPEQRPSHVIDDLTGLLDDEASVRIGEQPDWSVTVSGSTITVTATGKQPAHAALLPALANTAWALIDGRDVDAESVDPSDVTITSDDPNVRAQIDKLGVGDLR